MNTAPAGQSIPSTSAIAPLALCASAPHSVMTFAEP
jgi:hypothetical protein